MSQPQDRSLQNATVPIKRTGSGDFFEKFFAALDIHGIEYVVLHSYDKLPDKVTSDVDYAVRHADIPAVHRVVREVAGAQGWLVVQTLQHEVCSFYTVAVNPSDLRQSVKLDLCSDYMQRGACILKAATLLEGRRRAGGFSVPSASTEFAYLLAKALGKRKAACEVLPRLRELWAMEPERSACLMRELLGGEYGSLEAMETAMGDMRALCAKMAARNRPGLGLKLGELLRVLGRVLCPTGLCVALLGPDGVGKSTLIGAMEPLLEPCFRAKAQFHFRPHLFQRAQKAVVDQPHSMPPRGVAACWLKTCYYFGDHLAGYWFQQLPMLWKSTCIIYDRHFDDILVDPQRYRLRNCRSLALFLRYFLPRPALTFILDADPEVVHRRKPELEVEEIRRQRAALLELSQKGNDYRVISANEPPEIVAQAVVKTVAEYLRQRYLKRH